MSRHLSFLGFMQQSHPQVMMRLLSLRHFIMFEHADDAVDFKHGERDFAAVGDAMIAQRLM
jgi:hypothetical protein